MISGEQSANGGFVTEVFGEGVVHRDSEVVRICVTTTSVADDSDSARSGARKTIDKLYKQIQKLQDGGIRLPSEGLQSSFSISPVYRHRNDMHLHVGYSAQFSLTVESADTDKAGELFETLARVKNCAVDSPTFHLSDGAIQAMRNDAFKRAVAAAKERFAFQCRVIGFDPEHYTIARWRYDRQRYERSGGKRLSISDTVKIGGERATVEATVYLTFTAKPS